MNKEQDIRNWILCNLIERKDNRFDKSSYVLKHDCEFALGYYVSNDQFKKQMRELEFKYKTNGLNDYYALKKRLYQRQIAQINQFKYRKNLINEANL